MHDRRKQVGHQTIREETPDIVHHDCSLDRLLEKLRLDDGRMRMMPQSTSLSSEPRFRGLWSRKRGYAPDVSGRVPMKRSVSSAPEDT